MASTIFTHCDFDGAASAALVSYCLQLDKYQFATPDNIYKQAVSVQDIVCDLPYISGCNLWFDHHGSNIQEVIDRGLNPANLEGANRVAASAAQVAYDYFAAERELPEYFADLVQAANIVDTMDYDSIESWLAPTPANILNDTININSESYPAMSNHLNWLTHQLRDNHLDVVAASEKVQDRFQQKLVTREHDVEFIRKLHFFLPEDEKKQIVVIDCSNLSFAPKFNKTLALVVQPEAQYILLVANEISFGRKTNNLKISLAKNFMTPSDKQLGVFLEELNIGGGHDNAAGGLIRSGSKNERLRKLKDFQLDLLDYINS
ncbi:MAG: hypothetical protein K9M99_10520 [Candidatus Cloacimonetes bacterium]|nr:hypothetical protein [Candidatus Cloacimonadota bacterium]